MIIPLSPNDNNREKLFEYWSLMLIVRYIMLWVFIVSDGHSGCDVMQSVPQVVL